MGLLARTKFMEGSKLESREYKIPFADPNGSAATVVESRVGLSLSYVGHKLYQSLMYTHLGHLSIRTYIPDDLPQPSCWNGTKLTIKDDGLIRPIRSAA